MNNNTYIVSCSENEATVCAISVEAATFFARNYFGDSRTDYRNTHTVTLVNSEQIGNDTFYHFDIK